MDFISVWASAIAEFEGFNTAGSRPARNHNPGDLKFAGQYGAIGQDPQGFAIFPDDPTGWDALDAQLRLYVSEFPGYSLLQIMAHYLGQPAPTSDSQGNSVTYGNYVASSLGVDPSTTLATLASADAAGTSAAVAPAPDDGSDPGTGSPDPTGLVVMAVGGALVFMALSRTLGW